MMKAKTARACLGTQRSGSFVGLILMLVLSTPNLLVRGQDRVFPIKDVPASGRIVSLSPVEVKIDVRGKPQVYKIADVRKISFDDEPRELDRARELFLQQQYDQALEEAKKIVVKEIESDAIRQDLQFYYFYCMGKLALAGSGDAKKARDGLLDLARKNSNTHHLYDLVEMLGELSVALGENGRPFYEMMLKSPSTETQALARYRLAEVDLSENKIAEARQRLQDLATSSGTSPEYQEIRALANVGLAVCDNLAGKTDEALKRLEQLVDDSDSTNHRLFARISNAKGACYAAQEKYELAVIGYLHTDLLFFTDAEAHAQALYHLSKLWPKIGEPARAADAKARLVGSYASSRWANQE